MNAQFTVPSDQPNRIEVESRLIYALWSRGQAWAGSETPFEVRTALVGEGAPLSLRLMTDSGRTIGKKKDKIFGNRYRGTIAIPEKVCFDDMLYLEVELPKHNLSCESNRIPACPAIQVRSMQWSQTEVRRGDTVGLRAEFNGLPDTTGADVTIYEYGEDGCHDPVITIPTEINRDRMEILWEFRYSEETGRIPTQAELTPRDKKYRHPEYFFVVDIDGTRVGVNQESGLLKFMDEAETILLDGYGKVLKNHAVEICLPDGSVKKVKTDSEGKLPMRDIPPGPVHINYYPSQCIPCSRRNRQRE